MSNKTFSGFLAQEVSAAAQSLSYDFSGVEKPKNEGALYTVRYEEFVTPLVKTVQELSAGKEVLKSEAADLSKQLQLLQDNIAILKVSLAKCCPVTTK